MAIAKPVFLGEKIVILIDASDEPVKGSKKTDYQLHYAFDLFNFTCRKMGLTQVDDGERLTRYEEGCDDIFITEQIYSTMSGIEHIRNSGGDYIIRFKSKVFHLYKRNGEKLRLLRIVAMKNDALQAIAASIPTHTASSRLVLTR